METWRWTIAANEVIEKRERTAEGVSEQRLDAARAFAVEAARLAANTRCHNVVTLDVTDLSPVTDFFVIASGTSARQMRTVIDEIQEMGEGHGYRPMSRAGYEGESWIVLDFVDVIVHVFNDEARHFYDLENLWGDAKRVEWQPGEATAAGAGTGSSEGLPSAAH